MLAAPVISITTGAKDAPRLPPGAAIPSTETVSLDDLQQKFVAVADSAQTLMTSVAADLSRIRADARPVLSNLNDITGAVNRRHVADMLANADAMVAHLSPKMDQIGDEVLKLTRHAEAAFSNADRTVTALREPIQANLGELRAAIEQARALIGSMQVVVRTNSDAIHDTLENLRMATGNLRDVTESVKARPWSLIRIAQPKDRKVPE
jgi:ABC-type transporter Mla subunit MlaD